MLKSTKHIRVFEFEKIRVGETYEKVKFTNSDFQQFMKFCARKESPYFSIFHNGIQFKNFVGVIQVGQILYEVIPKGDRLSIGDETLEKNTWQTLLLNMLRIVHGFEVKGTGSSEVKIRRSGVLDLYFEIFISEIEKLIRQGLSKKYHKTEGNRKALVGQLLFSKHIQSNIVHQERFYVRSTVYDYEHILNQIIYKTLLIIKRLNPSSALSSRVGALLLNFPEVKEIEVSSKTFSRIVLDRKTQRYEKALGISKMILLGYHPDLSSGNHDTLTLMFDMNKLWEAFISSTLCKLRYDGWTVRFQNRKMFWESESNLKVGIKPDIFIEKDNVRIVLDTKWKNLGDKSPSVEDLRQMFVYSQYWKATHTALVYPGAHSQWSDGDFASISSKEEKIRCGIITIKPELRIVEWQRNILKTILNFSRKDIG